MGESYTFTETLNNLQSQPGAFEFGEDNPIPEWLTISPMYGTINPGGLVEVSIPISENMNYGTEPYTLFAETILGDEPLNLTINKICDSKNLTKEKLNKFIILLKKLKVT